MGYQFSSSSLQLSALGLLIKKTDLSLFLPAPQSLRGDVAEMQLRLTSAFLTVAPEDERAAEWHQT